MAAVLLIICCAAAVFAAGFFLMKRLDRFLDENRKSIEKESEAQKPCCVILDKEASNEEILDEIHGFRNSHDDNRNHMRLPPPQFCTSLAKRRKTQDIDKYINL